MAVLTFNADTATSTHDEQGTILIVGGAAGQLPPGRWRFAVVAENSNSQVCRVCCSQQSGGVLRAALRRQASLLCSLCLSPLHVYSSHPHPALPFCLFFNTGGVGRLPCGRLDLGRHSRRPDHHWRDWL